MSLGKLNVRKMLSLIAVMILLSGCAGITIESAPEEEQEGNSENCSWIFPINLSPQSQIVLQEGIVNHPDWETIIKDDAEKVADWDDIYCDECPENCN